MQSLPTNAPSHARRAKLLMAVGVTVMIGAIIALVRYMQQMYLLPGKHCAADACNAELHSLSNRIHIADAVLLAGIAVIVAGAAYLSYAEGRLFRKKQ